MQGKEIERRPPQRSAPPPRLRPLRGSAPVPGRLARCETPRSALRLGACAPLGLGACGAGKTTKTTKKPWASRRETPRSPPPLARQACAQARSRKRAQSSQARSALSSLRCATQGLAPLAIPGLYPPHRPFIKVKR